MKTHVHIPCNLNTICFIDNYTRRNDKKNNLTDGIHYFVHTLLEMSNTAAGRNQLLKTGYLQISRKSLCSVLRNENRVTEVIDILKKENIITTDGYFITGVKAKGYWLSDQYLTGCKKSVAIQSSAMRNAILKKKKKCQAVANNGYYEHLTAFLTDPRLTIDVFAVHHFLEIFKHCVVKKIQEGDALKKFGQEETALKFDLSIAMLKAQIMSFKKELVPAKIDRKGGRMHTYLTNMKKLSRYFLRYDNKAMVSIDLKASQPYLISVLLMPEFWDRYTSNPLSLRHIFPELYHNVYKNPSIHTIMSTTLPEIHSSKGFQGNNFHSIDWESDFYNMIMRYTRDNFSNNKDILKCYETRQKTKYHTMLLLFDNKRRGFKTYRQPFYKLFPEIMNLLDKIRGIKINHKNNVLPLLLQRIESHLFLNVVTRDIHFQHPEIPLYTIHDSIITTKGNERIVEEYARRLLLEHTGVIPGFSVEDLSHPPKGAEFDEIIESELEKLNKKKRKQKKSLNDVFPENYIAKMVTDSQVPLVKRFPEYDGRKILSTRYIDI